MLNPDKKKHDKFILYLKRNPKQHVELLLEIFCEFHIKNMKKITVVIGRILYINGNNQWNLNDKCIGYFTCEIQLIYGRFLSINTDSF